MEVDEVKNKGDEVKNKGEQKIKHYTGKIDENKRVKRGGKMAKIKGREFNRQENW